MQYQAHIPMGLTQKFIDKLGYEPENKRILTIRDFFTAMTLAVKNAVVFVTDDPEARDMFKSIVMFNAEFGSDDEVIYIDTEHNKNAWKEFIEELKNMPKFDVAIMNPPYDKSLHLKILEKVIPIANKVVNISPIRWLQDPLAKYKKHSDYNRYENSIAKKIDDLIIVPAKLAQQLFTSTVMNIDLGITIIGRGGYDYNALSSNSILNKVLKNRKLCNIESNKKDGWRVRMPSILGGKSGGSGNRKLGLSGFGKLLYFYNGIKENKPWYDWYVKNQYSKTTDTITSSIKFSSEQCCINFINSVQNTNFGKYITHKLITDVHVSNLVVLFMHSYQHPWTDKRFCNYFGITGFISDTEAVPGSEWEEILNTMKDFNS